MNKFELPAFLQLKNAPQPQNNVPAKGKQKKGDPSANLVLVITFKENNIYQYNDRFTGKKSYKKTFPRYSKAVGEEEPNLHKSLHQLLKNVLLPNAHSLAKAELYLNTNNGNRMNSEFFIPNRQKLEPAGCTQVANLLLHRFTEKEILNFDLQKFNTQFLNNIYHFNAYDFNEYELTQYAENLSELGYDNGELLTLWEYYVDLYNSNAERRKPQQQKVEPPNSSQLVEENDNEAERQRIVANMQNAHRNGDTETVERLRERLKEIS